MSFTIELLGKFYDNHSLSLINRNLAIKLKQNGYKICITPLDTYDPELKVDKKIVKQLKELESKSFETVDIQLRHTYPPIWNWPTSEKTKIVYIQPWEFEKVPFEWQYKFETFADAVVTPSDYSKNAFISGGINPNNIFVVANGYDNTIYNQNKGKCVKDLGIDPEKFNFVFVGNSQWRKGLDILLNVWSKTFTKADNARLIIKDNPLIYGKTNLLSDIIRLQHNSGCAKIIYIDEQLSDNRMSDIFKACKIVVHPYRAEGFGMHIQEAVACGCLPVISEKGATESFIPKDIGLHIKTYRNQINITEPRIFATKPGDSLTNMGSHSFINEPDPRDLQQNLIYPYQSHNDDLFKKVKEFKNPNTWDKVVQDYIKVFENIKSRTNVRRYQ